MNEDKREKAIADLNYPEAPRMVTEYPGPKSKKLWEKNFLLETPQRAAGMAWVTAVEEARGYRQNYGPLLPGVIHLPYPYCYRCPFELSYPHCKIQCAEFVDYQLNTPYTGKDSVAAIIAEGMQGEGGYVVPPKEWWSKMRQIADKNGCLSAHNLFRKCHQPGRCLGQLRNYAGS